MKDLIISEEIKAEASRLQGELHKFCVANGVPMVACTLQGRVKTTVGWKIEKMLSCHIDGRCGAVDTTILTASRVLHLADVPPPIALILAAIGEKEHQKQ
ncbi:TPA: hypothetical protein ACS624_004131 [Klebsiella michiganensis]|uniref:hypothetical protein n=1 Tax=Klebsiella TaxID=570 RepID=UPI0009645906|nr:MULTISPECIES: hypothetical protein [Klebsiella]MDU4156146.1 hypothetical protein [Klebsiella michiganensis]OLU27891.1 hypothetical protein BOQ07_10105 [Klebsiella michiganensis]